MRTCAGSSALPGFRLLEPVLPEVFRRILDKKAADRAAGTDERARMRKDKPGADDLACGQFLH